MRIFLLFDDDGRLNTFRLIMTELTEEEVAEYLAQGFIESTLNQLKTYINITGGEYGGGYIRDPETGEPIDVPPYEPTKSEVAERLFYKVTKELNIIEEDMKEALINNDQEFINLFNAKKELIDDYREALEELTQEEGENNGESDNSGGNGSGETSDGDNA